MDVENDRTIRFIDSHYKTLFFVPDGGNIIITRPDGEQAVKPCVFLDEYHTRVGYTPYHICQFAELMERAGNSYVPEKQPELPKECLAVLPATGELIYIEKGKKGYGKCSSSSDNPAMNRQRADRFNLHRKVTPQAEAAMLGGALKGWASPAARISSYDLRGNPASPSRAGNHKAKESER